MCTCSSSFHASTLCASTVPQPLTDNDTKNKKQKQKTKQSGFLTASARGKKGSKNRTTQTGWLLVKLFVRFCKPESNIDQNCL